VAKPVLFLEDTARNENSLYQAVNAQNPSFDTSIPGLALSARDSASENAKINQCGLCIPKTCCNRNEHSHSIFAFQLLPHSNRILWI